MSKINPLGWLWSFVKSFMFSPINIIFILAGTYFGLQAFVWEPNFLNRVIFFGIVGLWAFWILARYMMIVFVILAVVGFGYYTYYQYSTREMRQCEQAGGVWNVKKHTCEAKPSILDKITNFLFAPEEEEKDSSPDARQ
ncbi:MAG: hypothetical protein IJ689_06125 [Alphaproteobacteria bacterium]|nr:hypothetical protein [Alphaproteobacteria bacterium]